MRRFAILPVLAAVLMVSAAAQQPPQHIQRKRVAVLDFDYATVKSQVAAIWGTDQDIGKGIADLIVEKLVMTGKYSVIERKALDKVLGEQNFSNSDRADSNSAAKIGRILGVDAIITGSITQFGRDDKSTGVGGGAVSGLTGRFGLGGVKHTEAKAVVGISARMINTDTAEIIAVAKGVGESSRKGTSLIGAGGGDISAGAGGGVASKNFGSTILGEAVNAAVDQLCAQFDSEAAQLPTKAVVIDGLVADATGNTLVLNVGSRQGIKVGDRLDVRRKIKDVRDPASGKILRSITDKLGEVVVTDVDEQSAVGQFTGSAPAKVGDMVHNQ